MDQYKTHLDSFTMILHLFFPNMINIMMTIHLIFFILKISRLLVDLFVVQTFNQHIHQLIFMEYDVF
jgi:hypothetical protein